MDEKCHSFVKKQKTVVKVEVRGRTGRPHTPVAAQPGLLWENVQVELEDLKIKSPKFMTGSPKKVRSSLRYWNHGSESLNILTCEMQILIVSETVMKVRKVHRLFKEGI